MKKTLRSRIPKAMNMVEVARKRNGAFGLLGDISRLLDQMLERADANAAERARLAGEFTSPGLSG